MPLKDPRVLYIRVDGDLARRITEIAADNHRSVSQEVARLVDRRVQEVDILTREHAA